MRNLDESETLQAHGGSIWREIGRLTYLIGAQDAAFYAEIPPGTVLF